MKIKLIDFGLKKDHYPFRPHENGEYETFSVK